MVICAARAGAQATRGGMITGLVRRSIDSLPVALATVTLDSSTATAMADSSGRFEFRGVTAGTHQIRVRKVGYDSATAAVLVSADGPSQVHVLLQPTAQPLTAVQVAGRTVEVPSRYAGIAVRANRNHGALFTAKDFADEFTDRTKDILQRLPGVNVNDRSVTFARCQDAGTLPSIFGGTGHNAARVQVYVDGVRQGGTVSDILNSIHPSSIELMEVYTGTARLPAEFANDACAAIAIWTKAY